MMNLDDYHANSQKFHQLAKLIFFFFCGIGFYGLFINLAFRVAWFKEQPRLSQLKLDFKIGGI